MFSFEMLCKSRGGVLWSVMESDHKCVDFSQHGFHRPECSPLYFTWRPTALVILASSRHRARGL